MKKGRLLNQPLSATVAAMGHMDELVIADAGLPIPDGPARIDLALTTGVPGWVDTIHVTLDELQVEGAIVASEMLESSPHLFAQLRELLGDVPISTYPHAEFKTRTAKAKAVVRTGECTPYANVILIAGVVF